MNGNALSVLSEVAEERARQDHKFGPIQHIPDGTGWTFRRQIMLQDARNQNDHGEATFESVLREEVLEAAIEADRAKLRAELIQVAAVAVKWVEHIDRGGK